MPTTVAPNHSEGDENQPLYVYAEPIELDGKWYVTVTDSTNPDWEERKEFDSREEADAFIKAQIVARTDRLNKTKQAIRMAKNRGTKRTGNYVNANYETIELTPEQKAFVDANWDKMDLKTLTQKTFNNPELNGHHMEGKSVKAYIASKAGEGEIAPVIKTTADKPRKGSLELTPAQKATVDSLLNTEEPPTTKEMFKMLFPDLTLKSYIMPEYRAIAAYIKSVNEEAFDIWEEPVEKRRYQPPKNYAVTIGLVNKYVSNPYDPSKALYDQGSIKPAHEKNLKALQSYMQMTRFVLQASQYDKKADRDLFESTFVRQVQDKAADLLPEEVDMYLSVAQETVSVAQIERSILKQEKLIEETLDGDGTDDGSRAKLSMSLVESVNSLREKLDKSKARLKGLIESVAGSRNKRVDAKANQNDSIANLIGAWMEEKKRKEMIEIAKKEHLEDAAELERLETLDDTFALIAGMSRSEAVMGLQ